MFVLGRCGRVLAELQAAVPLPGDILRYILLPMLLRDPVVITGRHYAFPEWSVYVTDNEFVQHISGHQKPLLMGFRNQPPMYCGNGVWAEIGMDSMLFGDDRKRVTRVVKCTAGGWQMYNNISVLRCVHMCGCIEVECGGAPTVIDPSVVRIDAGSHTCLLE